jgi:signal transduction histidine kinase/ActR/RegA family two-component response regulator
MENLPVTPSETEIRVLVLTPVGRDAECIHSVIASKELPVRTCRTLSEMCEEIAVGAGCVLVAEEAIMARNLETFNSCLQSQPAWSDLPVVVLTTGGGTSTSQLQSLNKLMSMGNVTLLERPLRAITLLTGIQGALRGRLRQYVVRDLMLDQVKAREKESVARHEAERLNKVKDEFLCTLSHELRTPLTPLLGWTNMLLTSKLEESMRYKALTTIHRNVKTQIQLIDDLLDISRMISGKMRLQLQPVDLTRVVEAAAEVVRPAAIAKGVKLDILSEMEPYIVLGDFDRLQQVFWNLLTNAVKFTPSCGIVRAQFQRSGSSFQCIVSDTGVGIKQEFLPHLFERFSQADSSITRTFGGLGIGLSLVHSLLELHGGRVTATSDGDGKGAVFTVSLPIHGDYANRDDANSFHIPPETVAIPKRLDGLKVLLVEDHPETRDLLCAILSQSGSTVTSADSVRDGFQKFIDIRPNVIVSDLGLPDEDGYDLIRKVRESERSKSVKTPALALTAYAAEIDRSRCIAAGFQKHLVKPIDPAQLVSELAELTKTA